MEGSQKDKLSSEFPPWATGLMPMGNPGMSGSKGEHMLVSYHQKVRELGYFYTCQSLAEDFWGREGRWWVWLARGNFQTKTDWQLKVELMDDSALKWKHPRGYGWGTDSVCHISLSSGKKQSESYFLGGSMIWIKEYSFLYQTDTYMCLDMLWDSIFHIKFLWKVVHALPQYEQWNIGAPLYADKCSEERAFQSWRW